jgi:hypothetical protein
VAAGAAVLVLILLVLGARGCLDARKERAFKDYVRDVGALAGESDQQSNALFTLLTRRGGNAEDAQIENTLNDFRNQSARLVDRARATDRPDELAAAHRFLVVTLEFRRDGIAKIAEELPTAIADQGDRRQGTQQIAASMQNFLASDVMYETRVATSVRSSLADEGIGGQTIPRSEFLPDIDWLQPSTVADRVRSLGGSGERRAAAPGLHGNGIAGAALNGKALTEGTSVSTPLARDLKLAVQVANQGENTETDVIVKATIGRGGDALTGDATLDTIAAGETKPVQITITGEPATGQNVPVSVEVEPVPGEEKTDNNRATYTVIFTR